MKIKRILSLLAAATMAVTALTGAMTASAVTANGKCGDLTWTLDSDGKLTISGEGEMASPSLSTPGSGITPYWNDEEVQDYIQDYPEIYTYKEYTEDIKEVVIEEGVTSIGFCAFYKLPNLETLVLPSTISEFIGIKVETIGKEPSSASEFNVPEYVSCAFAECQSLKNLTLSEGMTRIGTRLFEGCTALESVTIPKTITSWGVDTFYQCSSLKNVTLSEGLTIIGAFAFRESGVESVVIPSTMATWNLCRTNLPVNSWRGNANGAFYNCTNLSSVTFAEGIEIIGESPFAYCSLLKKVAIPASVTKMAYAFGGCTGLEEAYIEEGAQIIDSKHPENKNFQCAFANCENLKRLEIPAGVNISYPNPQWSTGCTSLKDIYLHGKDYKLYIPDTSKSSKFHCYFETDTFNTLSNKNNLGDSRLVNIEDEISAALAELKPVVNEAKALEGKYTDEDFSELKALLEKAEKYGEDPSIMSVEDTVEKMKAAIDELKEKPTKPTVQTTPSSSDPTTSGTTTATTATKTTRSSAQVAKDKTAAQKAMKQAKITKLTVKSKAKKKITVTWKKVKKAKGYEVQVSAKKNFKKVIFKNLTTKNKITIKNNKIKSKKTYFVRVRAYATYNDKYGVAQKVYSKWNKKLRKVKVK